MRALVLGGTRYVGKRLVEKLLAGGHEVTVASSGKTLVNFSRPVEKLIIDRSNESSMRNAFDGQMWDIAYDQIGFNAQDANILVSALDEKIDHLVFTSSMSVYDDGLMLSESDFTAEIYEENPQNKNPYQEGKRLAEKEYTTQLSFSVAEMLRPCLFVHQQTIFPDDRVDKK